LDDPLDNVARNSVILAASFRAVGQSVHTAPYEASANPRYLLRRQARAAGDLGTSNTVPAQKNDPGAPHVSRWSTRTTYDAF
jgi:hypothetical protein